MTERKQTKPKTPWRAPSYSAPMGFARLMLELVQHPLGLPQEELEQRLGIESRAFQRYLQSWEKYRKEGFPRLIRGKSAKRGEKGTVRKIKWPDQPALETVTINGRRWVRFRAPRRPTDATAYEVASLYFMLTLLRFLEGTVLKHGLEGLIERIRGTVARSRAGALRNLDKKFYAITIAPKAYAAFDEILDDVLLALLHQRRLRIEYRNVEGEGSVHEFDPYTLVAYRGGLYLLGRSHRYEDLRYLAIERMKKVEPMRTAEGSHEVFAYPPDYDPAKRMDGLFGIVEGKATKVVLLLRNQMTVDLLRPRSVHPTAKYEKQADGTTLLRMTVNGTAELVNWVLSHSPWVEILEPRWLRDEIADRAKATARLYAPRRSARAAE